MVCDHNPYPQFINKYILKTGILLKVESKTRSVKHETTDSIFL